jgi:hypothetical protein
VNLAVISEVKNIPLSADDGQIHRTLTLEGCNIEGIFREKLRVDGRLTNCDTGDRLVISSQIFLLNTIMCTYVWLWENKIMRTVYHSMTLLIA